MIYKKGKWCCQRKDLWNGFDYTLEPIMLSWFKSFKDSIDDKAGLSTEVLCEVSGKDLADITIGFTEEEFEKGFARLHEIVDKIIFALDRNNEPEYDGPIKFIDLGKDEKGYSTKRIDKDDALWDNYLESMKRWQEGREEGRKLLAKYWDTFYS